ncbi:glycoside hydrolase family 43 protein [Corallococcus aberystwythensis]|uniref:Glycoside hydrolase n=1 Tax=Corallococcus aberystwythensis TaxID=2316722 RepID=A0A3A8PH89_9BACT|nr:glycoside hydrolase family 43 protein [Corallococcus aberystwythensis]RKH54680.1 glycoside hydrolase [Corallococcus aberystwythensis]
MSGISSTLFRGLFAAALVLNGCASKSGTPPRADVSYPPVFRANFPDPFILEHEGRYLAYATNDGANVQMAASTDLTTWQLLTDDAASGRKHDAMPVLPPWVKEGFTWAPEVLRTEAGYVLYFTARHAANGLQCIGVATSRDPLGPFTSDAAAPLVCQEALGGTIDASPFRAPDGQLYLYFKNDGNHSAFNKPTELFAQRLSPDGLQLVGEPVSLVRNDKPWERHVVEAPTMVERGGAYFLFFSAGDYGWQDSERVSSYAIGYATCEGPLGPCVDAPTNPFLASASQPCLSGPGHQTVFQAGGRDLMAFHSWSATQACGPLKQGRFMHIAQLSWENGVPRIAPR